MNRKVLFFFIIILFSPSIAGAAQGVTENYGPVVAEIVERGNAGLATYDPGNGVVTGNLFSRLYFDVFESSGMEFTLSLKDNAFMLRIESGFSLVISQSMRGEKRELLEKSWTELKENLDYAVVHYSNSEDSFWGKTMQSFLILFREGIEAMLVVAALVAYLRRSGYPDKVRVIWHGVWLALVASVVAAWLIRSAIEASGADQEAMEGVTMLLAAAVLLYVSYWLTAKRDADRWQAFIKEKMDAAVGRGSMFALGFVAFLAVFREGAETILFYQALIAGSAGRMTSVWTGMGLATAALVAVYLLVRLASVRLPVGLFFGATAILLYVMAFVFTGNGILELQVAGMVPTTRLEGWPMLTWLGIFPTWETVGGQLLILALLPLGWLWLYRKGASGRQAGEVTAADGTA